MDRRSLSISLITKRFIGGMEGRGLPLRLVEQSLGEGPFAFRCLPQRPGIRGRLRWRGRWIRAPEPSFFPRKRSLQLGQGPRRDPLRTTGGKHRIAGFKQAPTGEFHQRLCTLDLELPLPLSQPVGASGRRVDDHGGMLAGLDRGCQTALTVGRWIITMTAACVRALALRIQAEKPPRTQE